MPPFVGAASALTRCWHSRLWRSFYADDNERRPEKFTGDRITRNTNRVRNKEARVLAGYPAYAKTGRRVALEQARCVFSHRVLPQCVRAPHRVWCLRSYVEDVVTNMEGISKNKASLAEYRYRFGITRPVPVIVNGSLRLTTKVRPCAEDAFTWQSTAHRVHPCVRRHSPRRCSFTC